MSWKVELEKAVQIEKNNEPPKLEAHISADLDKIESSARKIAFAIHDQGFVNARLIFEPYWTGMSSDVGIKTDIGGFYTSLTIEREMSYPFYYIIDVITTENGILINKRFSFTYSDTAKRQT